MFRPLQWAAKVPGVLKAALQTQRLAPARRLTFSILTVDPIPDDVLKSWAMPSLEDRGVFRDVKGLLATIDKRYTLEAAERLADFDRPVLLAWAPGEKFFPYDHARRLADIIPDARIEAVEGARTFLPLDRPDALADLIRDFVRRRAGAGDGVGSHPDGYTPAGIAPGQSGTAAAPDRCRAGPPSAA